MQRWEDEFLEAHDGMGPSNLAWQRSLEWDRANANLDELQAREFDVDRIWHAIGLFDEKDYEGAFRIWLDLADHGSVWSMIEVGRCYEFGYGVDRNIDEAEKWYRRAFAGGSQTAMLKCAKAAARREDFSACEAILQVGVNQDWAPAKFWIAWYRYKQSKSRKTYRSIAPLLKDSARLGHPAAEFYLANFTVRGKFGLLRVPLGFLRVVKLSIKQVMVYDKSKAEGA
jgi:TPR repeat protein